LASNIYGFNTNWYIDLEATGHVTRDLEKLSLREMYNGHASRCTPEVATVLVPQRELL
jgi:hypothetical protein